MINSVYHTITTAALAIICITLFIILASVSTERDQYKLKLETDRCKHHVVYSYKLNTIIQQGQTIYYNADNSESGFGVNFEHKDTFTFGQQFDLITK